MRLFRFLVSVSSTVYGKYSPILGQLFQKCLQKLKLKLTAFRQKIAQRFSAK